MIVESTNVVIPQNETPQEEPRPQSKAPKQTRPTSKPKTKDYSQKDLLLP